MLYRPQARRTRDARRGSVAMTLTRRAQADHGVLGDALRDPGTRYIVVYHLEIALLFTTLVLLGPLLAWRRSIAQDQQTLSSNAPGFGLAEFPG